VAHADNSSYQADLGQPGSARLAAENTRAPHLDMIRGVLALAVCIGHLRSFLLVDYDRSGGGLAARISTPSPAFSSKP
jgi:peptidoglycan/LPS O-acetylase OafA/YrhL